MSNKITNARVEQLKTTIQRKEDLKQRLQEKKDELQALLDSMDDATEQIISSSSRAAKENRDKEETSLTNQDVVDSHNRAIERLAGLKSPT